MNVFSRFEAISDDIRSRIIDVKTTGFLVRESRSYTEDEQLEGRFRLLLVYILINPTESLISTIRAIAQDALFQEYFDVATGGERAESLRQLLRKKYDIAFDFAEFYILLADYEYYAFRKVGDEYSETVADPQA